MNTKIKAGLGVVLIIIFAITTGVFVFLMNKNNLNQSVIDYEKIYSVDELMNSSLPKGTKVRLKGLVGECTNYIFQNGYEGLPNGCKLIGENKEITILNLDLKNFVNNELILEGNTDICGGKKIPIYTCSLSNARFLNAEELYPEIINWKEFQNTEYGFSIKYPSDFITKEDNFDNHLNKVSFLKDNYYKFGISIKRGFTDEIGKWLNSFNSTNRVSKNVVINGKIIMDVSTTGTNEGGRIYYYFVKNGSNLITVDFSFGTDTETREKIIYTLRITNEPTVNINPLTFYSEKSLIVFLKASISENRIIEIKEELGQYREIKSIEYFSKEMALKELKNNNSKYSKTMKELNESSIGAFIVINANEAKECELIKNALEMSNFKSDIEKILP